MRMLKILEWVHYIPNQGFPQKPRTFYINPAHIQVVQEEKSKHYDYSKQPSVITEHTVTAIYFAGNDDNVIRTLEPLRDVIQKLETL